MENTPLTSIKVSDETFKKLQIAVEKSGITVAEVRRLALDLGLEALERIDYKVRQFTVQAIADAAEKSKPFPLKSVEDDESPERHQKVN